MNKEVAVAEVDPGACSTINRHGMMLALKRVPQSTSKRFGQALFTTGKVHLCRAADCQETADIHCKCFAHLAVDQNVDVFEIQSSGATTWALGRIAALALHSIFVAPCRAARAVLRCCFCCRFRVRRAQEEASGTHSPDSESEAEDEEKTCQAHVVRWEDTHTSASLCLGGCPSTDVEKQLLLTTDRAGLGGEDSALLCSKHRALYLVDRWAKRCPMEGCCKPQSRTVGSLPLCASHADQEKGRRRSPAPVDREGGTLEELIERMDLGGKALRQRRPANPPGRLPRNARGGPPQPQTSAAPPRKTTPAPRPLAWTS
jgi:hypothetical protein